MREDEAKARAEELEREQKAIDAVGTHLGGFLLTQQESEARLNVLRRRAGSPQASAPSSSFSGESSLLERHRQEKHREEKKERKQKARLDFDWPSEKNVKVRDSERGHERRERDDEEGSGRQERTIDFQTAGHLNFWADLESVGGTSATDAATDPSGKRCTCSGTTDCRRPRAAQGRARSRQVHRLPLPAGPRDQAVVF